MSRTARLADKFQGAAICLQTLAEALAEKRLIQNLVMAKLGGATIDDAQAMFICDQVITACERRMS
ncbi:hypothetical protein [Bradyrhizobium sp. SZCCHNR1093]|uniref:hypothetical protein n=1 Tax=Bradyrhizobium sp. SZCCHNR1093 TaxID=3057368 RepID=UPI0028EFAE00|nr:hypothetical protein [Bradyrhizobium sp. SZCCHNR1093]